MASDLNLDWSFQHVHVCFGDLRWATVQCRRSASQMDVT